MSEEIKDEVVAEVTDNKADENAEQPKYTQADIDRIVGERLAREKSKAEKAIADAKAEAERKKLEEANEFKALYEAEKAAREQEAQERQAERLETQKKSLLLEAGYSADALADLLELVTGDSDETVKASVERLVRIAPPKNPADPAVSGGGQRQQPSHETLADKGRKRFEELKAKGLL